MRAWRTLSTALVAPLALAGVASSPQPAAAPGRGTSSPRARSEGSPAPEVPVLSLRRLPEFVSRAVADVRLTSALDGIVGADAQACLLVRDSDGRVLYDHRAADTFLPASNLKLVTGAAVLDRLGTDTRLRTQLRGPAPGPDGVVAGDVWLVGGGDPLLATAPYAAHASFDKGPRLATSLERLADLVRAAGVTRIDGRVLGDEGHFDTQRYVPTWPPRYIVDHESGPISALSVNQDFVRSFPPAVTATPASFSAATLVALLQQRGVIVAGGVGEGTAPAAAPVLASLDSPPLLDVVGEMLSESDNFTAEVLLKELGARFGGAGTTTAGTAVVRATIASMGIPIGGLTMVDGSGLDRGDRVSCDLLVRILEQPGAGGRGGMDATLPVAGRDGTLRHRFLGTPVAGRLRAKTGSILAVTSLSGFALDHSGHSLTFALVINDVASDAAGVALQDRLAFALVGYPETPVLADLAPKAT